LTYLGQGQGQAQGQGQTPRSSNAFGGRSVTHSRLKYLTVVHVFKLGLRSKSDQGYFYY